MAIWKTKWGWRADFVLNSKRISAKEIFQYKDAARQWIKEEKNRLKSRKRYSSSDKNQNLSFWFLAQKYLSDCKQNFNIKTFKEKKYCLQRFYSAVGNTLILNIDPPIVLGFINERARTQSNYAANKDRKNLKAFFRWVQEIYGIMHDPTAPIRKKPHTKKTRRIIPVQDILKIILAAQGHDRVLISAYWHTGARKGEILRLTWTEDINFEQRWVRLGTRKNRTGEMAYEKLWMNDDLYNLLMWQWRNRHPTSPYVFCHMNPQSKYYGNPYGERRKTLKTLCEKAKVEPLGYHDIRHTVAKYLNDLQKVSLKKVQQVLRHKRQSTTEIYVEGNYTDTQNVIKLLEIKHLKEISPKLSNQPRQNKMS